jgi:hypothetical protein
MTCAMIQPMRGERDDVPAHKMPAKMSSETLLDLINTAATMQQAIIAGLPESEILRLRDVARAQAEAYLDLMAEAAVHVRSLRP